MSEVIDEDHNHWVDEEPPVTDERLTKTATRAASCSPPAPAPPPQQRKCCARDLNRPAGHLKRALLAAKDDN